ncbi:MAG: hypothetical protein F6K47_38790 [Symploca sp. SIO2E6]|nr:hypothetical protein [Symploca sp. SIO2E6]
MPNSISDRYFHATTLDAIDQFLSAEHPVKKKINVEVVSLAQYSGK